MKQVISFGLFMFTVGLSIGALPGIILMIVGYARQKQINARLKERCFVLHEYLKKARVIPEQEEDLNSVKVTMGDGTRFDIPVTHFHPDKPISELSLCIDCQQPEDLNEDGLCPICAIMRGAAKNV